METTNENLYQMSVYHYFGPRKQFTISAKNKEEAVKKGKIYVCQNPIYSGGNYDLNDVKCEKKINNKKKERK